MQRRHWRRKCYHSDNQAPRAAAEPPSAAIRHLWPTQDRCVDSCNLECVQAGLLLVMHHHPCGVQLTWQKTRPSYLRELSVIAENLLPLLLTSAAAPLSCRSVLLLPLLLDMPRRRTDQARVSTTLRSAALAARLGSARRWSAVAEAHDIIAGDAVLCFGNQRMVSCKLCCMDSWHAHRWWCRCRTVELAGVYP